MIPGGYGQDVPVHEAPEQSDHLRLQQLTAFRASCRLRPLGGPASDLTGAGLLFHAWAWRARSLREQKVFGGSMLAGEDDASDGGNSVGLISEKMTEILDSTPLD